MPSAARLGSGVRPYTEPMPVPSRPDPESKPRVGISACLLGERVRYDGDHKLVPATEALAEILEWVPVCPEAELGLGVPRPPMRIQGREGDERLVVIDTGEDLTERMRAWSRERLRDLVVGLSGFVLKSRSPSCGEGSTPRFDLHAREIGRTRGLFADELIRGGVKFPVVEEIMLVDPLLRQAFVTEVRYLHGLRVRGEEGP